MKPPSVSLPKKTLVAKQLLRMLLAHYPRGLDTHVAHERLAEAMGISSEQRWAKRLTARGEENAWENRVRYARLDLVEREYMQRPAQSGRGVWRLTEAGVRYAKNPSGITLGEDTDGEVDF
ncbi:MAG: hypothetical protein E7774_11055 [Bradyrhizobium sp.]|nr:MAG: hypothetical protein E7774_11055 [Bradyrhizobium sp.]